MDKFHKLYFRTSGFARRLVSGMKQFSFETHCHACGTESLLNQANFTVTFFNAWSEMQTNGWP